MKIKLKIKHIFPKKGGEGKHGPWERQEFVGETDEQYPKEVKFDLWGDRTSELLGKKLGQEVEVEFDIESREWDGRWYTNLRAWKVKIMDGSDTEVLRPTLPANAISDEDKSSNQNDDDLPF